MIGNTPRPNRYANAGGATAPMATAKTLADTLINKWYTPETEDEKLLADIEEQEATEYDEDRYDPYTDVLDEFRTINMDEE